MFALFIVTHVQIMLGVQCRYNYPWELVYQMVFCLKFRFVSFLLNFSHVGTEPWLPGYYQYLFRCKYVLLKDTTLQP